MSNADFDDSASACAIDALSIVCKRSTPGSEAFLNFDNEEVENVYSIIKSGEASRNDLEDASSSNILWCSIVLLLKNNTYFAGPEDVNTMASDLPVHVQRFFGALFSTFEVLMDHQRSNHAYLVVSLVQLMGRDIANVQTTVIQMTKEYKSMFSYAYMFNRRTGAHPVSQVQQVSNYFEHAAAAAQVQVTDISDSDRIMTLDDDDDDNDSYERLMRANTGGGFNAPKFGAPSVMPLRPVKMLSDDEHYGSDYQPAIASDLETDLTYNSHGNNHNHHRPHEDSHGALQDDSIFSMDGGSILNSYYKYNGWNNAVEEDEDSDNDHYAPPVVAPARPKRMTRMRQATSRSFDNDDAQESKDKKVRKKKPKKGTAKTAAPLSGQGGGKDANQKLPWASMASKGILSDDSDESNDDEESDYSESDHVPVQRVTHVTAPAPSALTVADTHRNVPFPPSSRTAASAMQVQNDEVEEFEMDDDAYTPTTRTNPAPSHAQQSTARNTSQGHAANTSTSLHTSAGQGYGRRRDTEAHSPSSGNNSSIELSDRERRKESPPTRRSAPSSSATSDWRSGNNRAQPQPHTQDRVQAHGAEPARRSGGRMRSVLSDDDESEADEVATAARLPTGKAVPVRNPLDASIETTGFGVFKDNDQEKRTAGTSRNPLDQSIELSRSGGGNAVSSSADWTRSGSSSSSQRASHTPPVAVPAPAARSVVRLPSASPSKPAAASSSWASGQGRGGATEGSGVDLVEDWDSQTSDEDQVSPQPELVVARRDVQSRGNAVSTAAPLRSALSAHERRQHERGEESPQVSPQKSPPSDVSPSRAAEMERLRQNVLRKKREKEAFDRGGRDRHVEPPSRSSEPTHIAANALAANRQRDPSPSTLRKSVTFEDQHSQGAAPAVAPRGVRQAATEEEDFPLVAPLQHRSVSGSAADMVLYGSQQSASWKFPEGEENEPSSEEEEEEEVEDSQNPLDSPYGERDRYQSIGVAGAGMRGLELPPQTSQLPLHQEQSSPKVPPSRSHQPSYAPPPALSASVSAPPPAPPLPAPTLSRVTSDQFMPVRATQQQESSREPVRDPRVTASRQFSSSNLSVSASISRPLLTLPGNFVPPPLSEFAINSGIIMEGYLHKKSGMLGIWQKRYFVLAESTTHFCVLRIFTRAVAAGWGPVAVGLKASIPIHSIEAVESVAAPAAKGKEFTIKFHPRVSKQSLSAGADRDSDAGSDAGSEFSDSMFAAGGTKLTTLLAEDAQTRLLWVTMLTRVLAIAIEEV